MRSLAEEKKFLLASCLGKINKQVDLCMIS